MSLHYLLDGYNIINQVPRFCEGTLEDRRLRLLAWLNIVRPQGSARNAVTVVFDGDPRYFGRPPCGCARVIFTAGESADDCLKRMVERSPAKKKLVVVSDDKDIKLYARALGAGVLGVGEFAADLVRRRDKKTKTRPVSVKGAEGKHISLTQAQKINKEFERIWLP
ncbi:MAG: NYN domain-containing protein [Candidatus Omnitrophica bacterium]|nr:NYN domain-containing protein [Candidatus Omnitrophota bacterium]